MKLVLAVLLLCSVSNVKAQLLSGDLLDDRRKMVTQTDFRITSRYEGYVVYELAVDPDGNVTSTRFISDKSSIQSTPANMEAREFLKLLKFAAGDYYPKHHHVLVKLTYVTQKTPVTKPKTVN